MGLCPSKSGSWLKTTRRENKGNCIQIVCGGGSSRSPTLSPAPPSPSLHMAVFGWNFTQLGWDYLKPPFVFLSIIMFALSWSCGFSSGKLFAAAPLPPTWLTDVWLFWYTGINIAVTDMFSFLCCLSSLHSASQFYSVWANNVVKKQHNTKTVWVKMKKKCLEVHVGIHTDNISTFILQSH